LLAFTITITLILILLVVYEVAFGAAMPASILTSNETLQNRQALASLLNFDSLPNLARYLKI